MALAVVMEKGNYTPHDQENVYNNNNNNNEAINGISMNE